MEQSLINACLNDLLVELHRSLVQYACDAWPWSSGQGRELSKTIQEIADGQQKNVEQLVVLLRERRHRIDFGVYPNEYPSLHYVALEYLYTRLLTQQSALVSWIESQISRIAGDDEAESLVREIAISQREALKQLSLHQSSSNLQGTPWMK